MVKAESFLEEDSMAVGITIGNFGTMPAAAAATYTRQDIIEDIGRSADDQNAPMIEVYRLTHGGCHKISEGLIFTGEFPKNDTFRDKRGSLAPFFNWLSNQ